MMQMQVISGDCISSDSIDIDNNVTTGYNLPRG